VQLYTRILADGPRTRLKALNGPARRLLVLTLEQSVLCGGTSIEASSGPSDSMRGDVGHWLHSLIE